MPFGEPTVSGQTTYQVSAAFKPSYVGNSASPLSFEVVRYGNAEEVTASEPVMDDMMLDLVAAITALPGVQYAAIQKTFGTHLASGESES